MNRHSLLTVILLTLFMGSMFSMKGYATEEKANIDKATMEKVKTALISKYGETARFRVERGVQQAAGLWRETDGVGSPGTELEFAL